MSDAKAPCPKCGESLSLDRVQDLTTLEFRARCTVCGWRGNLRNWYCGGCHERSYFAWDGERWACMSCGRTRRAPGPRSKRSE